MPLYILYYLFVSFPLQAVVSLSMRWCPCSWWTTVATQTAVAEQQTTWWAAQRDGRTWWRSLLSLSQEPHRRQERRFWATLQQQHGSQRKPSLKAKLIKSPITLLCMLTVCCHRGEAPLMRLRSVIYNGGLSNRKLLCCSGIGFTFLNISQTSEA